MGAHILAQMCRYLKKKYPEELCGMIVGADAARAEFAMALERLINMNDAEYVQLLISDVDSLFNFGTKLAVGHDNIYFKDHRSWYFWSKHYFAYNLHMRIATGYIVAIAEEGNDGIIRAYNNTDIEARAANIRPDVGHDQCLIGTYSKPQKRKEPRNFTFSMKKHAKTVYNSRLRV